MLKWIRRNQKKILALFCIFGMISFLYGLVPSGMRGGPTNPQIGTINGKPVMRNDVAQMRNEWQTLKQLHYVDPNNPDTNEPFVSRLPYGAADVINKDQDTFFLLVQEALDRGIVPNNDEVQSILTNNIAELQNQGPDAQEQIAKCVSDFLLVQDLLTSDLQMIKTNAPARDLWKAKEAQKLALDIVMFPADHYLPQVAAPTDMEIKNQFDAFNDRVPGELTYGAADDPLGFGYKYPNRVKVQYMGLKAADIYSAAKASRTQQDWYVAAYNEYKANRDQYDSQPISTPTTQPSAATQPTAQHVDDLDQDFTLHVQLVLDRLYAQAADELHQKLLHQISDAMTAGYAAWHDAQAAGATTQNSANAYTDVNFMQDLAQTIEKQTGVLPVVGVSDQLKEARDLLLLPGIGQAMATSTMGQPVLFAQYAVADPSQGGVGLWQPSDVFSAYGRDPSTHGQDSYIFRISQFDPSHTPALDEVRDKVISDCKLAAAYKLALAAAKNLLADAQKRPWDVATAGMPVITTDLFRPAEIIAQPMQNSGISPLKLGQQGIYFLAKEAQGLVTAAPGSDGRPVAVAEIWSSAIASVIHLQQASPMWNPSTPGMADLGAFRYSMRDSGTQLVTQLCTKDAASQRVNFQLSTVSGAAPPVSP
jgi:hypothetical protein